MIGSKGLFTTSKVCTNSTVVLNSDHSLDHPIDTRGNSEHLGRPGVLPNPIQAVRKLRIPRAFFSYQPFVQRFALIVSRHQTVNPFTSRSAGWDALGFTSCLRTEFPPGRVPVVDPNPGSLPASCLDQKHWFTPQTAIDKTKLGSIDPLRTSSPRRTRMVEPKKPLMKAEEGGF